MRLRDGRAGAYREALAHLQEGRLQKTTKGLPGYTRFVNRPLGRRVAAAASVAGLAPNQLTVVGSALTFTAVALLALVPPSLGLGVGVTVLLGIGFVLDSADGPLARLRGGGTPAGEWLDHVADAAKHCLLHSAVLVAWYRWFDLPSAMLGVPIVFLVAEVLFFFTAMLTESLKKRHGAAAGPGSGRASVARALVLLPIDYGSVLLSFVMWGSARLFAAVYSVLAAAIVGYLLLVMPKWYSDVRALAR